MLKSQNGKKAFSTKPASQDLGQQDNNDTVLAGTLYTVLCHTGHVSLHDTGEFLKSAHGLVRKTCSMESRKGEGNLGLRLTLIRRQRIQALRGAGT